MTDSDDTEGADKARDDDSVEHLEEKEPEEPEKQIRDPEGDGISEELAELIEERKESDEWVPLQDED